MNRLNVIINERGIERVSITATSEDDEKRLLSLYQKIRKDLTQLDKNIASQLNEISLKGT